MSDGSDPPDSPEFETAPAVYERITDAVFALDEERRITFCNERAERLLGRPEAELVGTGIREAVPETLGATFEHAYERAMERREHVSFEAFAESLDGWFEVRAYPSETGVTVTVYDVSDRVQRTERLRKRERALQDVYDIVADRDRSLDDQIRSLLAVVRRTIGTEYATLSRVHEAAGEYIFEVVDAPAGADLEAGDTAPLEATNCEHVVNTERTLVLEDVEADAPEFADRAGNAEWGISCYLGTPILVDDEVYGTFCFYDTEARASEFSDWEITFVELLGNWVSAALERRQYERDLEESNDRLGQFAYAASHDLQEPLRMVSSYLSLVERRYGDELDADGREFVEYAVEGAGRMQAMIDGLLAYSQVETGGDPLEPVDLNDVLEDARSDLNGGIEETDAAISSESLPRVRGDASQLRQVLQNLLSNALEYSGDEPPRIHVGAQREGNDWIISVSDEGIGIAPAEQDRVFDVFQRLHTHEEHAGTGIGLALCRRIVERHGGDIWIDSEPGEGATVLFTLPAVERSEP